MLCSCATEHGDSLDRIATRDGRMKPCPADISVERAHVGEEGAAGRGLRHIKRR